MTGNQIRQQYLDFMKAKGHAIVPSSSLVPENDPTTLFTTAGMQPMITYLLGETHPLGTRIADSQKSFRAEDIDEVGDNRHTTFFEMLGNWSLGDYFKQEQLTWIFEFLTDIVGLDPSRLYVTVFSGDPQNDIPKDAQAAQIWKDLFQSKGIEAKEVELVTEANGYQKGMQGGRIFYYEAKKNWWSRAGVPENMPAGEPGGPDSEVFFEFTHLPHDPKFGPHCHPNCDCGRFLEIGNSVFMAFIKKPDNTFEELPKKNIDFGGGLERIAAAANDDPDVFKIDLLWPLIELLVETTGKPYQGECQSSMRVIADHLRAATFLIADGVTPSNKMQGYVLRRLLRRAMLKAKKLSDTINIETVFSQGVNRILATYHDAYFSDLQNAAFIHDAVCTEIKKFDRTLKKGLNEFEKYDSIDAKIAFNLYQTYGFPLEITEELVRERGSQIDKQLFRQEFQKHQDASRTASKGVFKGGLADHSEQITKFHTATHLLHQALRQVLGEEVQQMGSNITNERLRFDFKYPEKMSEEQKRQVEALINQKIQENLPVNKTIEPKDVALKSGALAFFREKYPEKVSVYTIGKDPQTDWFSKELCGGPHVSSTGEIGTVTIKKEESVGAGVRRIYMVAA